MAEYYVNNVVSSLNGGITNVATTLTIASATGFPTSGNFRIIIKAEGANNDEICTVTGVSGTTRLTTAITEAGGNPSTNARIIKLNNLINLIGQIV